MPTDGLFIFAFTLVLTVSTESWKPKVYWFYSDFTLSLHNLCNLRRWTVFLFRTNQVFVVYGVSCSYYAHVYYFLRWVRWMCYYIMLGLVRAARQQLRQAFGVRGQWLKPLPCTGAAHSCGKQWRGDKRLVAFPFHWERQPTFCHQSKYSPPSPCGMIIWIIFCSLFGQFYIQKNHMLIVSCFQSSSSFLSCQNSMLIIAPIFNLPCIV